MSDEDMKEEDKKESPAQGALIDPETRHQNSPELRMLHLLERLTERVETNEGEAERREERIQRNIEFILRQQARAQAQAEADTKRLREVREENDARWARTDESWERASQEIRALLAIAEIHEREIFELRQTQVEEQARTDAKLAETGGRVDALVNTVERLISERRNGGGEKSSG